ncbi:hypothetical protein ACOSQ4_027706 [Xanthoceras sorbifolium]
MPFRNITALGAVARNSSDDVIMSGIDFISAIFFGLSLAVDRGLLDLVIESDCAQVIKLLNDNTVVRSDIGLVLNDIREILRLSSPRFSFVHIRRSGNLVAHSLAKLAFSKVDCCVWVNDFPRALVHSLKWIPIFLCNLLSGGMNCFSSQKKKTSNFFHIFYRNFF